MQIIWEGQSCFQIITSRGKEEPVNIVIDPFSEEIGLKPPKLEADILLITHSRYERNSTKAISGNPFIIDNPGEYEIKEVIIQGILSWYDVSLTRAIAKGGDEATASSTGKEHGQNTIYTIEVEGVRICHLGNLGQKELTSEQLEKIGNIDILMIPIGGIYTISAKEAMKIMAQIEPKIIIPMHYQIPERQRRVEMKRQLHRLPKLNPPAGGKLDGLDKFLKMVGVKSIEPLNKLSIKKKDLSEEEVKIVVLKP